GSLDRRAAAFLPFEEQSCGRMVPDSPLELQVPLRYRERPILMRIRPELVQNERQMQSGLWVQDDIGSVQADAVVRVITEKKLIADQVSNRGALPARIGQYPVRTRQGLQAPLEAG